MFAMIENIASILLVPASVASAVVAAVVVGLYFVFTLPTRPPIQGVPGLEDRRESKIKAL